MRFRIFYVIWFLLWRSGTVSFCKDNGCGLIATRGNDLLYLNEFHFPALVDKVRL